MTVIHCTAKLRKRLRLPTRLPEPEPATGPLGHWYADVEFYNREPFVVLLSTSTGAALILPGRAADLRDLHLHAGQQLFKLFTHFGFDMSEARVREALLAWGEPPIYANTKDRSLLGSLNRYKFESWVFIDNGGCSMLEVAIRHWKGLFRHPSLVRDGRKYGYDTWQRPLTLVRERLGQL